MTFSTNLLYVARDNVIFHPWFHTGFVGKKTFAFSRYEIPRFEPPENSALISINDTDAEDSLFMDFQDMKKYGTDVPRWDDVCWFRFDDCAYREVKDMDALTPEQAKEIAAFVRKNEDKHIFVHCSGGISRSAGVASVLEMLGWNTMWLPRHHPNAHVKGLLMREFKLLPEGAE